MKTVAEKFLDGVKEEQIKQIRLQAQTSIGIAKFSTDFENEDYYETYLFDVVSGHWGQYQTKAICEYFGIKYQDDESALDEIDKVEQEVANRLTKLCDLTGTLYYNYLESDGSYGLFYREDKPVEEPINEDKDERAIQSEIWKIGDSVVSKQVWNDTMKRLSGNSTVWHSGSMSFEPSEDTKKECCIFTNKNTDERVYMIREVQYSKINS